MMGDIYREKRMPIPHELRLADDREIKMIPRVSASAAAHRLAPAAASTVTLAPAPRHRATPPPR